MEQHAMMDEQEAHDAEVQRIAEEVAFDGPAEGDAQKELNKILAERMKDVRAGKVGREMAIQWGMGHLLKPYESGKIIDVTDHTFMHNKETFERISDTCMMCGKTIEQLRALGENALKHCPNPKPPREEYKGWKNGGSRRGRDDQ
jgi:hypothetical protein